MAYDGPDEWIAQGQIPKGVGDGTESIKTSWVATNRAATMVLGVVNAIQSAVTALPGKVVDAIAAKRWAWGNQEKVPPEKRGTNNIFEATEASNTLLFGPNGLEALHRKVDALSAKLDAQSKT